MEPSFFERVYLVVQQIPRGKVASYGQVAGVLGHSRGARTVGWALSALSPARSIDVPWQRVVSGAGHISISRSDLDAALQRQLLEDEGIVFGVDGGIDLRRFGWAGLDGREAEGLWSTDLG